jgi:cytochrome c biogenesis protein CcdA
MWLWNTWSQNESKHVLFFDGLVASLFFYHGLSQKHRIVTFVASFVLGGLPSYFAIQLTPETQYGHEIACGLIAPLIGLVIGGAYYTMRHLKNSTA